MSALHDLPPYKDNPEDDAEEDPSTRPSRTPASHSERKNLAIDQRHSHNRPQHNHRKRQNKNQKFPSPIRWLQDHADVLLMPILPLLWCLLLMTTMDRNALMTAYAMPLLGIASATLANSVPVGGGIVFVPVLSYVLGDHNLHLGPPFAVATMTFGNGVFGFLNWLRKDPSSIAWHIVPYAVVPAWIGSLWAMYVPILSNESCRTLFALFCLKVSLIVARGIYLGDKQQTTTSAVAEVHNSDITFSILEDTMHTVIEDDDDDGSNHKNIPTLPPYHDDPSTSSIDETTRQIVWACGASFLAGSIWVAHIGIGNAMTTFLVGSLVWQLPAKSAVVTAIICGGWTSIVPFLYHLVVKQDVPIALWVMGLPGVYLGARIAPKVHEIFGIYTVLRGFCLFLLVSFWIMI